MSTEKQEPLDIVLSHYGMEVSKKRNESYKDKKGVWWVNTNSGTKILKKISNSEETLRFILDAIRHLVHNGVNIPGVNLTRDQMEYVCIDDVCYILTDAIEGRNPSYSSPDEMTLIVGELAKFHKASVGFHPSANTKPKYHLGLWVEDYTEQLDEIKTYYENEYIKQEHDPINAFILKEFPYFYNRGRQAIEGLKGKEYEDWVHETEETGNLCHQDFAAGNLIVHPDGRLFVLDTDSITIDIAARDIRKLLNKVMKKIGKWDKNQAKRILKAYQKNNPLTPSQWEVVKLDLLFPHLFLGAVNKFYYRRDKEWTDEKYLKRIIEMSSFEKTAEPVLDQFGSILPV